MNKQDVQMVIITGMSGAGKTVAMQSFEDLGFFCVDNLPPALLPKFVELMAESHGKLNKVALVMDLRGREFFDQLFNVLDQLSVHSHIQPQIMYLESKDAALVRRYKETRRSHPLAKSGNPLSGIEQEREMLQELKGRAQLVIDTTDLKPIQLREKIIEGFSSESKHPFTVNVMSFGFKYGMPIDADLVFDVRFLPNPHYIDHMRPRTGLEPDISEYVLRWPETKTFLEKLIDLLNFMIPQYKREGKSQLIIGIGCTGGKHRSVALTEYIKNALSKEFVTLSSHRDMGKDKS
ncbi:glmZ(sRNA)-inactivating NTPase [Fictibacillus macauensis ZFHKF-1]|uniref:GlmZ(SRNA)-inactivating NTPase n=1 Tax=Fictibacillus macauensis ZFHKF-1 TaxID=1196324 RepID=I8UJN3_9BACL|nr:RNase adapter RapZ [Fictibacillus macauensis]EIT87023.1 glmZ(sRNA)-inactivating NTPase [Fictibacillus macauensis ZFHKF-1]